MHYPMLNATRCCSQHLCTECYLQLRPPRHNKEPCPFCKHRKVEVVFRGPRSKEEMDTQDAEQRRADEAIARAASNAPSSSISIRTSVPSASSSTVPIDSPFSHVHQHYHDHHDCHPSCSSVEDDDSMPTRLPHSHLYSHIHDRESLDSSSFASGGRGVVPADSVSAHASAGSRTRTSFRSVPSTIRCSYSSPSVASHSAPPSACMSDLGNEDDDPCMPVVSPGPSRAVNNQSLGDRRVCPATAIPADSTSMLDVPAGWSTSSASPIIAGSSTSNSAVDLSAVDSHFTSPVSTLSAAAAAEIVDLNEFLLRTAIERSMIDC
jgi:hypothetical protein